MRQYFAKPCENDRYHQPMDAAAEETWVKNRLDQFNQNAAIIEQNPGDGRWIRYDQHQTADGKKVCVRTDITDEKNAADSFRLLFENNPVPMWVVERSTLKFIDINSAALELYGYTREQFLNMTSLAIRPPSEYQRAWDDAKSQLSFRQRRKGLGAYQGRWNRDSGRQLRQSRSDTTTGKPQSFRSSMSPSAASRTRASNTGGT